MGVQDGWVRWLGGVQLVLEVAAAAYEKLCLTGSMVVLN